MSTEKIIKLAEQFEKWASEELQATAKKEKQSHRGDVVFPANSAKNKSNKDRFPINDIDQARNAISRANQYDSNPEWHVGTLQQLVNAVVRKVKSKYPSIEASKAATKPGKG